MRSVSSYWGLNVLPYALYCMSWAFCLLTCQVLNPFPPKVIPCDCLPQGFGRLKSQVPWLMVVSYFQTLGSSVLDIKFHLTMVIVFGVLLNNKIGFLSSSCMSATRVPVWSKPSPRFEAQRTPFSFNFLDEAFAFPPPPSQGATSRSWFGMAFFFPGVCHYFCDFQSFSLYLFGIEDWFSYSRTVLHRTVSSPPFYLGVFFVFSLDIL